MTQKQEEIVTEKQKRAVYVEVFGREFDDPRRKQFPLPLDIAYEVALSGLKKLDEDINVAGTPDAFEKLFNSLPEKDKQRQ